MVDQINSNLSNPAIDFSTHSVIVINNYGIDSPEVVKVIKTKSDITIQLKDFKTKLRSNEIQKPIGFNYLIVLVEKTVDLAITITLEDCFCSDTPCMREDVLCDFFDRLKITIANCIDYSKSFEENIDCFNLLYTSIYDFDDQYPDYVIGDSFDFPFEWEYDPQNPPSLYDALQEAYGVIESIKEIKGNCGCVGSDGEVTESICTTSIQEIRWKTINEYEYEQTIPGQPAISQNTQATMDAFSKTIQPIWRPDSTYMIRFRLKDEVFYNGSTNSSLFDYYYGFKTKGPVGHFHNQKNYLKYFDEKGIEQFYKEEEKALTSLRSYLDYKRSYPNPDGNLLGSKPLFFGNEQCKIDLFFDKPYTAHMFSTWKAYKGLSEIKIDMPIIIKDPVSETVIPYPLPKEWEEEDVPGVQYEWVNETDPKLPLSIQTYLNFWLSTNTNPENTHCKVKLGNAIVPPVKMRTVSLTNLKPQKLYTAIIYNAYDANGDGEIKNQITEDKIIYEENQKVHEFAFTTSRYENFRRQVMSYQLSNADDASNSTQTKQAVYEVALDLTTNQINNLYALVSKKPNAETDALRNNYIHEFDGAIEGVLNLKPLDPPTNTDFVKIMNRNMKNEVVAILVRNLEPFNDPRVPLKDMEDALTVLGGKEAGSKGQYKILWSKDYSQALIMNDTKKIVAKKLQFQFLYKTWDGNATKYIVKKEKAIKEGEKLNTVVTEPIILNK